MNKPVLIGLFGLLVVILSLSLIYNPSDETGEGSQDSMSEGAATAPGAAPEGSSSAKDASDVGSAASMGAPGTVEDQDQPATTLPSFDVVRVNPDGDAVLAGRSAPNAQIRILNHGKVIGTVRSDQRGEWVWVPDTPFAAGEMELTLQSESPLDGVLISDDIVVLIVPEKDKDIAGRSGKGMALILKRSRSGGGSHLLQSPSGIMGEAKLSLDVVDYDDVGQLVIGGRAKPRATLLIYLDNALVGQTSADDKGRWTLSPSRPVAPGVYSLRLDHVNADGKVIARIELPFSRAEPMKAMAAEKNVVVQPGNSLWRIARRVYGSGFAYAVIYDANQGQISDPDLIYPGQIFEMPEKEPASAP